MKNFFIKKWSDLFIYLSKTVREWFENGSRMVRQMCAAWAMLRGKLVNGAKSVMQIFVESAKSAKPIYATFATFATFASTIFVGKESNESTVRYREWSRISLIEPLQNPYKTLTRFRLSLGSAVSRVSLASLICLCMLTVGVGNAWGTDETLSITRNKVTTANNYGTDSEWSVGTISGKCQIYGDDEDCLRFNGGKPNGTEGTGDGKVIKSRRLWNTTATAGRIKSIKVTAYSTTYRPFRVFCGTSAATSSSNDSYGTEIGSAQTIDETGYTWNVPAGDNYTYFMVYENNTSAAYIASIVVTYESAPAVTYSVTWKSDGVTVHTDAAVPSGTTVSTPSDPEVPSGCMGAKFMGWTEAENYSHATDAPGDLFNGTSPTINSAKTYYAVFADPN